MEVAKMEVAKMEVAKMEVAKMEQLALLLKCQFHYNLAVAVHQNSFSRFSMLDNETWLLRYISRLIGV